MNYSTSTVFVQVFEANHVVGREFFEDICHSIDLKGGKIFSEAFKDHGCCVKGIVEV